MDGMMTPQDVRDDGATMRSRQLNEAIASLGESVAVLFGVLSPFLRDDLESSMASPTESDDRKTEKDRRVNSAFAQELEDMQARTHRIKMQVLDLTSRFDG